MRAQVDIRPVFGRRRIVPHDELALNGGVVGTVADEYAAATVSGVVAGYLAAFQHERMVGIHAAAIVVGRFVADNRAVFQREGALAAIVVVVVDAAALPFRPVVGNRAIRKRRRAIVLDAAAFFVARGVAVDGRARRRELRALGHLRATTVVIGVIGGKRAAFHRDGSVIQVDTRAVVS